MAREHSQPDREQRERSSETLILFQIAKQLLLSGAVVGITYIVYRMLLP
jgi:hypothetical protein